MEAFINSLSAISPQNTFAEEKLLHEAREYNNVRFLRCVEPQYSTFIDPMASRRMSRIIKMGVCSAIKCLQEAGINNPDAIITGTGMGCVEDTGRFLASIFENEEKLLNPTPFIQSTHNTVGASIALILKCKNYNNTYGHRGFSFESALLDGIMMLQEEEANDILVGALDELTPDLFTITDRLGFWKKDPVNNLHLKDYRSRGSLAGEGTTFFSLSRTKNEKSFARIRSLQTFLKPAGQREIEKKLTDTDKPDLVILGINGNPPGDEIYNHLKSGIFVNTPAAYYKHLCGEYDTSSAFALAMAAGIIREQHVPDIMKLDSKPVGAIRNILIYNHLRNVNHSVIQVSSC
ncbi:MAG: beta-ketoacyl synthase chain length factor [Bacteroidia bacterium]|nr:beta-ketoacyl synthase chain length factor [Bacteroidia bacterium]